MTTPTRRVPTFPIEAMTAAEFAQLVPQPCPACGTFELRVLFHAGDRLYATTDKIFRIVECRKCGQFVYRDRTRKLRRAS